MHEEGALLLVDKVVHHIGIMHSPFRLLQIVAAANLFGIVILNTQQKGRLLDRE